MNRCDVLSNYIKCGKLKADSILITSNINRLYLSGFNSSYGFIVIFKDIAYLLVDFRYFEAAKKEVKDMEVLLFNNIKETLSKLMKDKNISSLSYENEGISLGRSLELNEFFKSINVDIINDINVDKIINQMRMIKSNDELKKIKESQRLTDESFNYIINRIRQGMTEREIALDIEFFMRKNGADRTAFDFIIASGENTSMPHAVPTNKVINDGDLVTMDIGSVLDGYNSDMTRTVAMNAIDNEKKKVYDLVLDAQIKALNAVKSGIECSYVDKIARDTIYNAGYNGCFGHATGHSVGLEVHERPSLSPNDKTILKENMVITIEPGIYIENKFGVRIEDMVVIKKDNCTNFTSSTKELIVL